jgi:hypothetical protein
MQSKTKNGLSRKSTLILMLSMFAVAFVVNTRILFSYFFPISSIQTSVGLLIGGVLIFFGLVALTLRLFDEGGKKNRVGGTIMMAILAFDFVLLVATYLSIH